MRMASVSYTHLDVYKRQERMEDKLEYEIDIPHQYESVQVPRLILQPLVENAIIHGIETGGKVSIRVYEREEDGGCWLEVSDNGAGMDEEQLKRLRDGTTEMRMDHRSIGVEDVYKRQTMWRVWFPPVSQRWIIPQRQTTLPWAIPACSLPDQMPWALLMPTILS